MEESFTVMTYDSLEASNLSPIIWAEHEHEHEHVEHVGRES